MSVAVEHFSFPERAAAKARSRAEDERLLKSGAMSSAEMACINGGGMIARRAVRLGKSAKAQRILAG